MGYNVKQQGPGKDGGKFLTFEDLDVYKEAREFRRKMYEVTRSLPVFEKFELASQVRRAAVSLTNNIAEGHGRYHFADQVRFFLAARGSLQELIDDLNVCADEKYVPASSLEALKSEAWRVLSLINGFLRYLRDRKSQERRPIRETDPSPEDEDTFILLHEALHSIPIV